jgi:HEAT repeat protein
MNSPVNAPAIPKSNSSMRRFLKIVNLRPDEAERTFLMFLFYGATSIGAVWLEYSSSTLFLEAYTAEKLTWVYIATAFVVTTFGVFYSWLQKLFPLRWVMLGISCLLALPLPFVWMGLANKGTFLYVAAVFVARLWVEGIYVLSNINNDIAANQLFNIREIKRAFPLISTGIIVAEIVGGFSYPFLVAWGGGAANMTIATFVMLFIGSCVLFYLTTRYRQAFPNSVYNSEEDAEISARALKGKIGRYVWLLFGFFIAAQVLFFMIEFQYQSQLEIHLKTEEAIGSFLGIFGGIMGVFKLALQLFGSSRLIERIGVFFAVMIPPIGIIITGTLAGFAPFGVLIGFVVLKFFDELFRFTIVAATAPTLFQAVPDLLRSQIQSFVRGIADPLATGGAGVLIWVVSEIFKKSGINSAIFSHWFAGVIVVVAIIWVIIIWLLRRGYLELLIQSVERGQLSLLTVDPREMRRAVSESMARAETQIEQAVCIDLLTQVAPQAVGESLAPLLSQMTPDLQAQSIEAMLENPESKYLPHINEVMQSPNASPQVQALCLRYVLLADEKNRDIDSLRKYLGPEQNPIIRGTAVALMMRLGASSQVAEATNTLRHMITSPSQPERVLGCRALAEAAFMQSLRFYVPQLLQDPSIEVRCALLRAIAATRASEYFPSIIRGLHYKATRKAAHEALVSLGDDAIPSLLELSFSDHSPDSVRIQAWDILGEIGSETSISVLASNLSKVWGKHRRQILRTLIRIPQEQGIEAILELMGRSGIEKMVIQELGVMTEAWAGVVDFSVDQLSTTEAGLLVDSLQNEAINSLERILLMMKLLYSASAIQAAAFNILSDSKSSLARGVEILDNTVDLSVKQILLSVVDNRSIADKLSVLATIHPYQPLPPAKRLQQLIDLRYCLSDWTLACCFHVARTQGWSLTADAMLQCLEHPTGFVRESVISYLQVASPRSLIRILPRLLKDRDSLVLAQVRAISYYFQNNGKNTLNLSNNLQKIKGNNTEIKARIGGKPEGYTGGLGNVN